MDPALGSVETVWESIVTEGFLFISALLFALPFLVWMSKGFQQSRGLSNAAILRDETFPHDFPFHSVMGAFGLRSDIYKPQFDVFNTSKGGL